MRRKLDDVGGCGTVPFEKMYENLPFRAAIFTVAFRRSCPPSGASSFRHRR